MSNDKFKRWHDFSFRMAKTCYRQRKSPSSTWILATLDQCFEHIKDEGVDCFVSWDEVVSDWFQEVVEYEVWVKPYDFATTKEAKHLDQWYDKANDDKYDEVKEKIVSRVCEPIHCCLRAGLDLVGEQSGGVLGFTVGDLKRMYAPDPIPDWITSRFSPDFAQAKDEVWIKG